MFGISDVCSVNLAAIFFKAENERSNATPVSLDGRNKEDFNF